MKAFFLFFFQDLCLITGFSTVFLLGWTVPLIFLQALCGLWLGIFVPNKQTVLVQYILRSSNLKNYIVRGHQLLYTFSLFPLFTSVLKCWGFFFCCLPQFFLLREQHEGWTLLFHAACLCAVWKTNRRVKTVFLTFLQPSPRFHCWDWIYQSTWWVFIS